MTYKEEFNRWLSSALLSDTEREELSAVSGDDIEAESRFYAPLQFGTAGLRGIMGMGTNRMNRFVVRKTTQGLAELILREGSAGAERGVVICYDSRLMSREFAFEAACVMAGNGVHIRIFEDMRPTPELSFAVRHWNAMAGINITASHNPKEYNGYKVYWEDGAQLSAEHADEVTAVMSRIDVLGGARWMELSEARRVGLIETIGRETDEAYLETVLSQASDRLAVNEAADSLTIVYTPFHGVGRRLVPEALRRLGVRRLVCVEEQMVPDGTFPTLVSPNPENPEGFDLALRYAEKNKAQLILATDPDSDRFAAMVLHKNEYRHLSGNQMGVLMLDYLIGAKRRAGTLPKNAAVIKSIVTTEMARALAESEGIHIEDTFTGFKYLAEKIREYETSGSYSVIFSFEEAIGYLVGDFVRDKDAVTASVIAAEMASYYHNKKMTMIDALEELYAKYGYYSEKTVSLVMPGIDGLRKMKALMAGLRAKPPVSLGGMAVTRMLDYLDGSVKRFDGAREEPSALFGADVLRFTLEDGDTFIVRPSGTEPKIKVYIMARAASESESAQKAQALSAQAYSLAERL